MKNKKFLSQIILVNLIFIAIIDTFSFNSYLCINSKNFTYFYLISVLLIFFLVNNLIYRPFIKKIIIVLISLIIFINLQYIYANFLIFPKEKLIMKNDANNITNTVGKIIYSEDNLPKPIINKELLSNKFEYILNDDIPITNTGLKNIIYGLKIFNNRDTLSIYIAKVQDSLIVLHELKLSYGIGVRTCENMRWYSNYINLEPIK